MPLCVCILRLQACQSCVPAKVRLPVCNEKLCAVRGCWHPVWSAWDPEQVCITTSVFCVLKNPKPPVIGCRKPRFHPLLWFLPGMCPHCEKKKKSLTHQVISSHTDFIFKQCRVRQCRGMNAGMPALHTWASPLSFCLTTNKISPSSLQNTLKERHLSCLRH